MLNFYNLNLLAILITTFITFGIGAAWYTFIFGKVWQKETGLTDKQIAEGNMLVTYGGSFICFFLFNLFISALLKNLDPKTWLDGVLIGFQIGFLINITSIAINYLYQYKSVKLWFVDGGYQLIIMTVAGAILSVWK
jgi:hypothetical protein